MVRMASSNIHRRTLLLRSAQTAAFGIFASRFAPLFAAAESREFKIGACDWSLGKTSDPTALDVAKQIGLDGVQIDMGRQFDDMPLRHSDVQESYRQAIQRTGLKVASLAIGEMNNVALKRDPRAAQWLSDSIDVCVALKLPITMPACFNEGDLDMNNAAEIDHLVAVLKDTAPKAEKNGIVIALENYLTAEDNLRIIDRVGSSAVKVYYDVGNATDKGHDVIKEIHALGNLLCEMHAKDAGYMLGKGRIDFRNVRRALDDIDYHGWVHLEAATPHDIISDMTTNMKYLREILSN